MIRKVKGTIVNYFTNLFKDDEIMEDVELPVDIFPEFTNGVWISLTRPFTKCEIEMVVKSMGALKAP